MEEAPLNRTYLESLATGDLVKIADSLGVDVSQDQDRDLLIEELLEVSSQDEDETDALPEQETEDPVNTESVPLPKFYNITFIELMIRDPFWAFVFWEIKSSDKEQLEKAQDFDGYYLKVTLLNGANSPEGRPGANGATEVFSVQVNSTDNARYLSFAQAIENEALESAENQYIVELCARVGEVETVLAVSNAIMLPGLPEFPNKAGKREPELSGNPFVRLSGYGDFHILRRNERPPRTKRDEP